MKSYTLPIPALLTRHPPSTHILFRGNLKTDSLSHIWKILNNLGQNLTHFITTNCNFSLCDSSSQSCNYIYIIFNLQHLKLKEDNGSKILFISFFFCQTHILLWSCCWQHHVEMSFNCLWVLIQKYFLILCSFLEAGDKTYTSHLIVSLCMFPWFILHTEHLIFGTKSFHNKRRVILGLLFLINTFTVYKWTTLCYY